MQTLIAQAAAKPGFLEAGLRYMDLTLLYLGAVVLIYAVLLLGGRLLKRRYGLPLGWAYHFFCIAVAAFLPTRFPGIDLGPSESKVFLPLVVITSLLVVLRFIRHYFHERFLEESNAQVPKFLSQFISIAVTMAAIIVLLDSVYEVQVTGLLAGAGVVGIVLGLALQDTLGNIFSGFAIYFGGQFKAGDWLLVFNRRGVEFNAGSGTLRWDGGVEVPAELKVAGSGAALFLLK
jgi:small-conductance mechanosensitive channel